MSKYLRSCQVSFCSARSAPIKRSADASFGKMRITHSRRRTSSFNRSCMLVVRNRSRYFSGSASTASASSRPASNHSIALVALGNCWTSAANRVRASAELAARRTFAAAPASSALSLCAT